MGLFCGVMALACVPAAVAGNDVPYPKENVTEFVVEKLDVTTLPSTIRPKPEKNFDREMHWTAFACVSMSRS